MIFWEFGVKMIPGLTRKPYAAVFSTIDALDLDFDDDPIIKASEMKREL